MPLNYYQEDCEASNSSSGEDSQASDSVVLSPRKLHNRFLNVYKSRSKSNVKSCHHNNRKHKRSSAHQSQRSLSSCEIDSVDEKHKISPARLSASSKCFADVSSIYTAQAGELNLQPKNKHKTRMPQHRRGNKTDETSITAKESLAVCGEGTFSIPSQDSNESRRVFPFLQTPSGNLKVGPSQVVFESKKVSVLVADPKHTKVNVRAEVGSKQGSTEESLRLPGIQISGEISNLALHDKGDMPQTSITDNYDDDDDYEPSQLEKEFSLQRITSSTLPLVDYSKTLLPYKTELFTRLLHRITNYINPDVEILISTEVFSCHLLVLQCYSDYFDQTKQASKVRLPEGSVTPRAFMTVYNWMIYPGSDSFRLLTRENILEIFEASQYLGIKELEEQCWTFINSDHIFSEETAFLLYISAKEMGNKTIIQLMIPRIMRFFLKLVGTTNFLDLDLEDICTLMRSNYIAIHNEIEVFMAAVRWLMHDWMKRKLHLTEVMKCIRFGWIAPWQLVDIRRNPENPEFTRVTSHPDVQQLIEDGLSYAIIKYWYGNQTQDYYHWIDLLGLQEPNQRNWIDEEKNYVTYREFLTDLEIYQKEDALDTMHLRSQQPNTRTDTFPPPPTVAEFMAQRARKLEEVKNMHLINKLKDNEDNTETELSSMIIQTRQKSEEEIKTVFQNFNLNNYNSSNDLQIKLEDSKGINLPTNPQDDKFHITEHQVHSASTSESTANILEPYNTSSLKRITEPTPPVYAVQQVQQNFSCTDKEEATQVVSHTNANLIWKNNTNLHEKGISFETKPIRSAEKIFIKSHAYKNTECKVSSLFTHISKDVQRPIQYMHQMSISSLSSSPKNYLMEGSLFFPDEEAVLVFGGIDPHNAYGVGRNTGKDIYRYQPHVNSWELIGELPEPRHHHSVAFLKGKIFLVGGADPRDDDNQGKSIVVNTMWCYNPISRAWSSESAMLTPRKNFGLVVSNGKLYAIGGQDKRGRVLSSVECFDPITGIWEEMASLSVGRMGIAATKFRDFIWVAGGMTSSKSTSVSSNVDCFDTRRNIWLPFGTLRFPRCFSRLFAMNDALYLIGGAGRINETDSSTASIGSIDTWDDDCKGWRLQEEMAIPRHGHSLSYLGTQILIIGGVTTMYMRALSNVECFCCIRGTWIHGVANLPTPLSGHGSITLPPASLMS